MMPSGGSLMRRDTLHVRCVAATDNVSSWKVGSGATIRSLDQHVVVRDVPDYDTAVAAIALLQPNLLS